MNNIIIGPIITEKTMEEAGKDKFTFAVQKAVNKDDIKKAISKAFTVTITAIQTNIVKSKRKKIGKRRKEVNDSIWKRAVVTLKKGEKIDIFQSAEKEKTK